MNILFITHVSSLYGANRSMLDLLCSLDRKKYTLYVIGPDRGEVSVKLRKMGIPYKAVDMAPSVHYAEPFRKLFMKICKNMVAVKEIAKFIREKDINIVHTNSSVINVGAIAAWLTQTRHFWHVRELETHYGYREDCALLDNFLMHKSAKVICISKYVKIELSKHYHGENMITYYDPVILEKYFIEDKTLFESDQVNILCCGIIEENKRQMTLVKSIKKLHEKGITNLKLIIVGSGVGYAKEIQNYIRKNDMQKYVEMHPFSDDLTEYRKNADIAVMPSVNEALGRVTIESMLSGIALIGAASGATDELVKHGYNGLKYSPDSEDELADQIEYLIGHKAEAIDMARNAKEYAVGKFDARKRIDKLDRLYLMSQENKK